MKSMRIAWLTDIHLEFVGTEDTNKLLAEIQSKGPDALFITGDINTSENICNCLRYLAQQLRQPIYFVLGNHDFYGGSISGTRWEVGELCQTLPDLHWLTKSGAIKLTDHCCVFGHDGWADGRLGDYWRSEVLLNDFFQIGEFIDLGEKNSYVDNKRQHSSLMRTLADEAANHLRVLLPKALNEFRDVIVLTHVPPFRQACWHESRISSDDYLPFFANEVVGVLLSETMAKHPKCNMTVYCGHTHSGGVARVLPNLVVITGSAKYGQPTIQEMLTIV